MSTTGKRPRTLALRPFSAETEQDSPFKSDCYAASYMEEECEMLIELHGSRAKKKHLPFYSREIGEPISEGDRVCVIKLYRKYPNEHCIAVCHPYSFPIVRFNLPSVLARVNSFTGQNFEQVAILS